MYVVKLHIDNAVQNIKTKYHTEKITIQLHTNPLLFFLVIENSILEENKNNHY